MQRLYMCAQVFSSRMHCALAFNMFETNGYTTIHFSTHTCTHWMAIGKKSHNITKTISMTARLNLNVLVNDNDHSHINSLYTLDANVLVEFLVFSFVSHSILSLVLFVVIIVVVVVVACFFLTFYNVFVCCRCFFSSSSLATIPFKAIQ